MKVICCLMLFVLALGCTDRTPIKTKHKGETVPEFSLFLADSASYFNTVSLPEGRPVVFFYFGPGCPYSRAQMQEIIENADKLRDVQFVLFTTSSFDEMKWFYTHYKLDRYHNMVTGVDYKNFFIKYFEATGVPYLAIYDRNRRLKVAFEGKVPVEQLSRIVKN